MTVSEYCESTGYEIGYICEMTGLSPSDEMVFDEEEELVEDVLDSSDEIDLDELFED